MTKRPELVVPVGDRGRLPIATKAALIVEIATQYVRLRRTLRSESLEAALARSRSGALPHPPEAVSDGELRAGAQRLARVVDRTLGALPADSRCIMRALVLCSLLARRGVTTSFVIGVRNPGDDFIAHAWIELDGHALQATGGYPRLVAL